ncbi:MAG TPA: trehalase family glycosidase [Candidatus Saccharimonadales bacterium]|nr:trehalase family glycosidase [Candidatus Saccharimonadales bacterium]
MDENELLKKAQAVLKQNDRKKWTVPAGDLYPHQWLWDSCFIAIGLRHLDVERAQVELKSLLRGQWSNGMIPNLIFSGGEEHRRHRELWRSYVSPYAPHRVATSGITQPPMLAEAVIQIGQKLKQPERRSWYRQMYPYLLNYHQWLYADRDPHGEGLIILLHPYECGMDNSPPWISELRKHNMLWWISLIERFRLDGLVNLVRRDTRHVPPGQRMSNIEAMAYWAAIHRLRRKAYNSEALLSRSLFAVEDLGFNCILIRANSHLKTIAKDIGHKLPNGLIQKMRKTEEALEQLWDEDSGCYYSRSFVSHKLIEEPTIATLLPLYAGCIANERAAHLLKLLKSKKHFALRWPVPSVPQSSGYFHPFKYWQGPTWINTNWLIIDGLRRYGFETDAKKLQHQTLELVAKGGMNEYFSPLDGRPAGATDFSWTAALTIDLIKG